MSLPSYIMNIEPQPDFPPTHDRSYRLGHKEARHGAAELAVYFLAKLEEDLEPVRNLLAVCNGDGGHRQIEVGMAQAAEEAEEYVIGLRQRVAEPPPSYRSALDEVRRLSERLPTPDELKFMLGLAWSASGLTEEERVQLRNFRDRMDGP